MIRGGKLLYASLILSLSIVLIISFVLALGVDLVNLESPANNSWTSGTNDTISFTFNYTGENATASCELFIGDIGFGVTPNVLVDTSTTIYANSTISDGANDWYVNCTNVSTVMSDIWFLNVDTINPLISTSYPTNTTYATAQTDFNYTYDENNCDKVWFSNDSGATNYSVQNCGLNFTTTSIEGLNNWTVYINDSAGNENSSSITFTVDTTYPLVDYGSGIEDNNTNFSRSFIYVNVSVTEANEANITFGLYNSTGEVNSTIYTDETRTINWTNLSDGEYTYNVTVADNAGNSNTTSLRTITLDTTAPTITLVAPADSTSSTTSAYNFTFNVSDSNTVSYCSLIFDGSIINNLTSISKTLTNGMYNSSLSVATHTWSINCTDFVGNTGNSSTRTLIVQAPAATTTTTTTTSSGGYPTYRPDQNELEEGYQRVLYKNWKISFKVGNESHLFKVENITDSNAKIILSSEVKEATLSIGEERKFDLSGDNYYDVLVKLNSITPAWRNKANFTIKTIHEKINEKTSSVQNEENKTSEGAPNEGSKKTNSGWLWVLIVGLVILIFVKIRRNKFKK